MCAAAGNMQFAHFKHCVRLAEAGKFDLIFLADSSAVRDLDDTAIARELEHQLVKHEPLALLAALSTVTSRVGLVTAQPSTTYTEPFNLARQLTTLDHIPARGRAGWNMVTSFSLDEARNFGLNAPLPSDQRHSRASEYIDVFKGLEESWDNDALVRDKESGIFFDRARMRQLNHKGQHFSVRGPLDIGAGPQRHIPIFTAGESENAQELAARSADVVYGGQPDLKSARAYYASLKGPAGQIRPQPWRPAGDAGHHGVRWSHHAGSTRQVRSHAGAHPAAPRPGAAGRERVSRLHRLRHRRSGAGPAYACVSEESWPFAIAENDPPRWHDHPPTFYRSRLRWFLAYGRRRNSHQHRRSDGRNGSPPVLRGWLQHSVSLHPCRFPGFRRAGDSRIGSAAACSAPNTKAPRCEANLGLKPAESRAMQHARPELTPRYDEASNAAGPVGRQSWLPLCRMASARIPVRR